MFSPKDVRGHSDSDFRWFNWRVPYREREHVGPLVLSMASLKEARAQESLSMYSSKDVRIEGTKKTGHRHFTWSAWHWCALVLSLGMSEFWTLWSACCYVGLSCILTDLILHVLLACLLLHICAYFHTSKISFCEYVFHILFCKLICV